MGLRLSKLISFKQHPILKKDFNKLSKSEYELLVEFLKENQNLDRVEFGKKCMTWFLDVEPKPKNHTIMWALALQSR